ncbi:MAG: Lpg1974 family pore-forming outer membrane protein [Simkaniaceae bacterium]|nr:Lpg1974 family pore-forming outer membrane protein [Simkaniaceae bacterium]
MGQLKQLGKFAFLFSLLTSSTLCDEPTLKQFVVPNAMDTLGVVTAPARPEIEGDQYYIDLEPLLWHARVGGTAFAFTNNRATVGLPTKGETKAISMGWDFGFRVGLGYCLPYDGWDLDAHYLYYRTTDSNNTNTTRLSTLTPLKGTLLINRNVDEARSNLKLTLSSIDLMLGREFFVSPFLSVKPAIGLQTSWLNLNQHTAYSGGPFLDVNSYYVDDESKFWGIGPKLSGSSQWFIGNGFSLFGSLGFAMQYGKYDIYYQEDLSNTITDSLFIHEQRHQFDPEIDFGLGLGYGTYVNEHKAFFEVSLWYEGEFWISQNQMIQVFQTNASRFNNVSEDVSMHGATLKVRVNF